MSEIPLERILQATLASLDAAGIGFTISLQDEPGQPPWLAHVSPAAAAIFGRAPAELIGQNAMLPLAPEELETARERLRRREAGEPTETKFETVVLRPDGTRVPVEIGLARTTIDGRRASIAFTTDISERHTAERRLAESEARFRTLIEASPDVAIVCVGEELVYANPALARLLGFDSVDQLRGRQAADFIHPDELRQMRERWAALGQGQPVPPVVERRVRHKHGHFVTIEAFTLPIQFDGKAATLILGRDVSARHEVQRQQLQADRMAAVGTLAAGVAHEINNPLAYVMLNVDMVLRELGRLKLGDGKLAHLYDKLLEAREGADRVAVIVRDLLSFSRTDESWGIVDVRKAIDIAVKMVRADLRQRAELVIDIGELPAVTGNTAQLSQVVLNLLLNAMQALPLSGGAGGPGGHVVAVRASAEGGRLLIEVTDTGPGIPEQALPRLFEPFYTTKPPGEGTGLGLSVCHGIVTAMGGEIHARNLPGRGAAFTVSLPVGGRPPGLAGAGATPRGGS